MSFRKCQAGKDGKLYVVPGEKGLQMIMPQYHKLLIHAGKIQEALDDSIRFIDILFDLSYNMTACIDAEPFTMPKTLRLQNAFKSQMVELTSSQFQKWREATTKIDIEIEKLRAENDVYVSVKKTCITSMKEESLDDKVLEECEQLYVSVCGVYLRHETVEKLVCDGCEVNELSQHRHDCMMIDEAERMNPHLYAEMVKLSTKFLEIRDVFVRVASDLMPESVIRGVQLLPMFEKKYLYDMEQGHGKVMEYAKLASKFLTGMKQEDEKGTIDVINDKIL